MDITPSSVGDGAKNFATGQSDLANAWMRLLGTLDDNSGMAGDDRAASSFNSTYQPALAVAWQAMRKSVVVLGGTSLGLTQTANNHLSADHHSQPDRSSPPSPLLGPNDVLPDLSMAWPPTAIGPSDNGDLGWNGFISKLLVGYWPAANPDKLQAAANAWHAVAGEVADVAGWLTWTINGLTDGSDAPDMQAIEGYWTAIYKQGSPRSLLEGLRTLCVRLGNACGHFSDVTVKTRYKVIAAVDTQEVAIALSFGLEEIAARLAIILDPIVDTATATLTRLIASDLDEGIIAEVRAAAEDAPVIQKIEAQFDEAPAQALEDEIAKKESATSFNGPQEAQNLRTRLANSGQTVAQQRNVAVAQASIDGITSNLDAVSGMKSPGGTVGTPDSPQFDPRAPAGLYRPSDAEYKVLEDIASRISPNSQGTVSLYTERLPCPACASVIKQFEQEYPGVKVNVTYGR